MKIAVPFEDGQVFQHFGRSAQFKNRKPQSCRKIRFSEIFIMAISPLKRLTT